MPAKLKSVFDQLRTFWAGLSTAKRVALLVATSSVLVGVLLIGSLGSHVRHAYLFTELSPEDAASIARKLDELKVPHRIEGDGTAIMVPEERVHALRLELASAGLPRGGGVGFEIFDQSSIGATEFEQRVKLRRALEGELSRSIQTISGVKSARVHLVVPERRLFAARTETASASVVVKLDRGKDFGKGEVAGIVHLVVSAVPGLSRERVSVVSTDGLTLHRPNPDGAAGLGTADARAEQSREVALAMEDRVKSLLERVVGPGKADVRVMADLDSTTKERTEEHYEPSKTALRSEHKVEEGAGVDGATVAGVPGAQSNLPDGEGFGDAPEEGAEGAGGMVRRSQTRNWEVDRVTEKTLLPPGDVRRLSVAVLVDGKYEGTPPAYVPRDPKEIERLGALVKSAVGYDEARGDAFRIESAPFARLDGLDDVEAPVVPVWKRHWQWAAAGAAALMALLAAVVLVWRGRKKQRPAGVAAKALPGATAFAPALSEGATVLGVLEQAGDSGDPSLATPPVDFRARALELASADPATAAVILRGWIGAEARSTAARS